MIDHPVISKFTPFRFNGFVKSGKTAVFVISPMVTLTEVVRRISSDPTEPVLLPG